jgi:hypothetical protein
MSHKLKLRAKRFFASLLAAGMLISLVILPQPVSAVTVPTDASLWQQVSTVYRRALAYDVANCNGYAGGTFYKKCAHYVNIQLILNGVNTFYVGGNGNDEFDNYKNKTTSSGGKKIHAYPVPKYSMSAALYDIASKAPVATNILVGFQSTMTTAGQRYGHAMLITGIIGDTVYFTDNINALIGGVRYSMGDPIKCSIDKFVAYYGQTGVFNCEGIIWFEDTALTAAAGGASSGDEPTPEPEPEPEPNVPQPTPAVDFRPGEYSVNYPGGLRIRAGASTSTATLYILPYRYSAFVTEIKDGFGHIFCTIDGTGYDGWISLTYADRVGGLPPVVVEKYGSGGKKTSQQWFENIEMALSETSPPGRILLFADATLTEECVVGEGMVLDASGYSVNVGEGILLVRGGRVESTSPVAAAAADPFLVCDRTDGKYVYSCPYELTITSASLLIGNNVSIRFKVVSSHEGFPASATYRLHRTEWNGDEVVDTTYENGSDCVFFITEGIAAKKLGDRISVRAEISAVSGGKTYSIESGEMRYSAVEYVGSLYGNPSNDPKLDKMMAAMLNYATASQTYFHYEEDRLANRALPQAAKKLSVGDENIIRKLDAPHVESTAACTLTAASLSLADGVSIRLRAEGLTSGSRLLVWTAADFDAAVRQAETAGVSLSSVLTEANCSEILEASEGDLFYLCNIPPKKFADTYYFRLADSVAGEKQYGSLMSYSVTEYCAAYVTNGVSDSIDDLCRSICDYSAAARAYFGYTVNSGS